MARPKSSYLKPLAAKALADLKALDKGGVAQKLRAIVCAAKHPLEAVAEMAGVAKQTVHRWVESYRLHGVDGLRPKPKKPKPSKLSTEQKAAVLSWLGSGKTPGGKPVHWTLEGLGAAILGEFGITMGASTIWAWLHKERWKPKVPRPRHHSADAEAQAEFKKKRRR